MSKELKIRDRVRVTGDRYSQDCPRGTVCTVEELLEGGNISATIEDGDGFGWFFFNGEYELVASDTLKLWRDMSDAEKGALLLADHEGKVIEVWGGNGWYSPCTVGRYQGSAYRVKPEPEPEPVRETSTHEQWVSMHEGSNLGTFSILYGQAYANDVKGQTTIETVDGKPVRVIWEADSINMEEL